MLQRREMLLHTSLKVKRKSFTSVARSFATVSPEALHIGDYTTANNPEEKEALTLMKEVKAVTATVPASGASHTVMRNEIRGLMIDQGSPSFYVTINPTDIYNPVVSLLAGGDLLKHRDQTILVGKNPSVAARFFKCYMKAFIKCILGYDPK
ncbi:uncharacterized protein EV420DRAFT_1623673 [Desarmillaria tabescens]|uniref:Helitron helicase-like domain-containing protein n=1 Tax=Armillaria tabescens TaxID=1929756 RepID=A0AA39J2Q7_ARMTA|nr:uncharacterized protein EV420DRAFT_1623673 [Desarmillaria tabescens]KAK0435008.1 hypothetical protein EV420DRAFT_1623673 [Desarmillaria tabescens]